MDTKHELLDTLKRIAELQKLLNQELDLAMRLWLELEGG